MSEYISNQNERKQPLLSGVINEDDEETMMQSSRATLRVEDEPIPSSCLGKIDRMDRLWSGKIHERAVNKVLEGFILIFAGMFNRFWGLQSFLTCYLYAYFYPHYIGRFFLISVPQEAVPTIYLCFFLFISLIAILISIAWKFITKRSRPIYATSNWK